MTMMILKKRCWNCVLALTAIFYANLSLADVYKRQGCPMELVRRSATERVTVSEAEPAAKGTINLTGFDGYTSAKERFA